MPLTTDAQEHRLRSLAEQYATLRKPLDELDLEDESKGIDAAIEALEASFNLAEEAVSDASDDDEDDEDEDEDEDE